MASKGACAEEWEGPAAVPRCTELQGHLGEHRAETPAWAVTWAPKHCLGRLAEFGVMCGLVYGHAGPHTVYGPLLGHPSNYTITWG